MNNKGKRTNKYLLLALIMIAVFILPSCRTRITNNSEVSNVQYDEDGFLSETYEMRREELGLSTAERPILPDFGSAEDSNDDFSEGEFIDYNPDDYQEDFTETDNTNNSNTNNGTGSRTSGTGRTRTSGRRSGSSGDDNKNIVVILDLNDGRDNVLGSITVEEGGTYEDLPKENPKHPKGYKFLGWFTAKKDGTQVKADTKVTDKNNHTLYAHWEENKTTPAPKPEPKPETEYEITIDSNGGEYSKTKETVKGGKYELPPKAKREGYSFDGWEVGGKLFLPGDKIDVKENMTIIAKWSETAETHWKKEFDSNVEKVEGDNKPLAYTLSTDDTKVIQECYVDVKTEEPSEDYKYVIKFASSKDVSKTLQDLMDEKDGEGNPKYKGKTIVVISKDANKDKYKLAYQIALMNIIHNSGIDEGQAIADLLGTDEDLSITYGEPE